jgi:hypothetical protein
MSYPTSGSVLWERLEGESDRAFARFCAYRDLGPERSLAKLGQAHNGEDGWSRASLHELSEQWRWSARASAWDDEQDRVRRSANLQAIAEMAARQARDGLDMQKLAKGAMAKWVQTDPTTGQLVLSTQLSPTETIRLYRVGFEVERLARGEPVQVSQEKPAVVEAWHEEHIAAGIAYALAQAKAEPAGMGGGDAAAGVSVSATSDAGPVAGGAFVDSQQNQPSRAAAAECDPDATGP